MAQRERSLIVITSIRPSLSQTKTEVQMTPRFCKHAVLMAAVCLIGAAGDPPPMPQAASLRTACPGLAGRTVPAGSLGLPSGDAVLASATLVAAAPQRMAGAGAVPATPEFCKVLGTIAPLDPRAQMINFEVNLPIVWNGKALQYGGGGYNGTLTTGMTPLRDAAPGDALPLMRGYVTLGTDSGHQASSFPANSIGQFALNDEMLLNYGYAAYKKVRDVASVVMSGYYGRAADKFYYFGGSEGGREGLTMAQRFPLDFDGIVSVVPVLQLSMLFQSYIPHVVPQFQGGWLSPAKISMLAKFVAKSCDELDGIADGVVSNYLACPAHVDLQALRCSGGGDAGDTCLSDAQIATVSSVHSPYASTRPLANGVSAYPQWLYGNEVTPEPAASTMTRWVRGTAPPTIGVDAATASQQWLYGANAVKFIIARNPELDASTYRPDDYVDRVQAVSAILDSVNPDLSAYFAHGGKLIMRENMADLAQSPLVGINYLQSVRVRLGEDVVSRSVRLYVSPGSTHTGNATSVLDGSPVPTSVDLLNHLDHWVTTGEPPPDALVQVVQTAAPPFTVQASRPMCLYPLYPHYNGGDRVKAESYACVMSSR